MIPSRGLLVGTQARDWRNLYAKLESYLQLKDDWNSYNAARPTSLAVGNAEKFLDVLCVAKVKPKRVSPSSVGGIGITVRRGERKAYIEFLNAGKTFVLFSDGIGEPQTSEVSGEYQGYIRLIGDIRKYLNA
jgi:hypothetical protein